VIKLEKLTQIIDLHKSLKTINSVGICWTTCTISSSSDLFHAIYKTLPLVCVHHAQLWE